MLSNTVSREKLSQLIEGSSDKYPENLSKLCDFDNWLKTKLKNRNTTSLKTNVLINPILIIWHFIFNNFPIFKSDNSSGFTNNSVIVRCKDKCDVLFFIQLLHYF